jgi:hypothetical protein
MHCIRQNVNNNLRNVNICQPNYTLLTLEQSMILVQEQAHHYKKSKDEEYVA